MQRAKNLRFQNESGWEIQGLFIFPQTCGPISKGIDLPPEVADLNADRLTS